MLTDSSLTLHVVSLPSDVPYDEQFELSDIPEYQLEDMGVGVDWGRHCTENRAAILGRECWLIDPADGTVVYRFNPHQIVYH